MQTMFKHIYEYLFVYKLFLLDAGCFFAFHTVPCIAVHTGVRRSAQFFKMAAKHSTCRLYDLNQNLAAIPY